MVCYALPTNIKQEEYPLPGEYGLIMAPIQESVDSVALSGSDSNQRFKILAAGDVSNS